MSSAYPNNHATVSVIYDIKVFHVMLFRDDEAKLSEPDNFIVINSDEHIFCSRGYKYSGHQSIQQKKIRGRHNAHDDTITTIQCISFWRNIIPVCSTLYMFDSNVGFILNHGKNKSSLAVLCNKKTPKFKPCNARDIFMMVGQTSCKAWACKMVH